MARQKRDSDIRNVERKKLKNALKTLQTKVENGKIEDTAETRSYINSLESAIQNSYAVKSGEGKGQYKDDLSRFQNVVKSVQQTIESGAFRERRQIGPEKSSVVSRKNKIFEREINQASVGGVSSLSKIEVKTFYAATEPMWRNKDINKRNEAILKELGVTSLEDAYKLVLENPEVKKRLEEAKKVQKDIETEQEISDGTRDEKDEIGSPIWLQKLKARAKKIDFFD